MSAFKEMETDLVWKLLEGHTNVLGDESKKEEAFFRTKRCPTCGGSTNESFVNPQNPFTSGAVLPNKLLRCASCRTEFDPHTGLIMRVNPITLVPG